MFKIHTDEAKDPATQPIWFRKRDIK